MVQIQAPATPQFALGNASVDSAALTEDSIEGEVGESKSTAPPPSGFHEPPSIQPAPAMQPDSAMHSRLGADEFADTQADPLRPAWESEKTAKSRQVALLVALGSTALVSSVLVFVLFIRGWGKDAVANVPPNSASQEGAVEQPNDEPATDEQVAVDVDAADADSDSQEPENEQSETSDVNDADGESKNSTSNDQTTESNNDNLETTDPPADLIAGSPLDDPLTPTRTPTKKNPDTTPLDASAPDENEDGPMPTELPPGLLQDFSPDFNDPKIKPNLPTPPTIDDLKIDRPTIEPNDPTLISSPPDPINARQALGVKMAFNAAGGKYPLNDLTLIISQTTGVPIHLEWVSFDLVGTDIGTPIGVPKGWLTVQELLNQISASTDSKIDIEAFLIRLQPTEVRLNTSTDAMMDLSDLKAGQTEPADLLNRLLYGKSNPVSPAKLIEPADLNTRQLTSIACEAFRRVRSVQGKLPDETLFRWSVPMNHPSLEWPIVSGIKSDDELFSSDAAASLLRRIARNNRATCYINWIDANRKRMSPVQRVMPYMGPTVDGGTAIADALEPFKLQGRKVDEQHWWIGSPATYDHLPVITWTEPLTNPDDFRAKIALILAANDGVNANLVIDPETDRAMLLVPRYLLRQLPKMLKGTP